MAAIHIAHQPAEISHMQSLNHYKFGSIEDRSATFEENGYLSDAFQPSSASVSPQQGHVFPTNHDQAIGTPGQNFHTVGDYTYGTSPPVPGPVSGSTAKPQHNRDSVSSGMSGDTAISGIGISPAYSADSINHDSPGITLKQEVIDDATPEQIPAKPKRKRANRYKNASPAVIDRRRAQNRASQRNYRERKDRLIKDLDDKLSSAKSDYANAQNVINTLESQVFSLQQQLLVSHTRQMSHSMTPVGSLTPGEPIMSLSMPPATINPTITAPMSLDMSGLNMSIVAPNAQRMDSTMFMASEHHQLGDMVELNW